MENNNTMSVDVTVDDHHEVVIIHLLGDGKFKIADIMKNNDQGEPIHLDIAEKNTFQACTPCGAAEKYYMQNFHSYSLARNMDCNSENQIH